VRIIRAAFWVAGIVLFGATLVLTAHLAGNSLEFSRYNTGWNGTSQFFSGLDRQSVTDISDPAQLTPYRTNALLLIIAPRHPATGQETAAYRAFLDRGNTIMLSDDFGSGNSILRQIGSGIFIGPGNLSSIDREYTDPYSVVVYRAANTSLVRSVSRLVLNRPAPLEGGDVLFVTSILSWIDTNGDRRINSDEVMGKFAVMAKETVGTGELVVLSDPSIFINAMADPDEKWDNRRLIESLTGREGPVLIDQMNSRTRDAEGTSEIIHVIRTTSNIELLFVGTLMLITAVAWRRKLW
jgi:hypothetical protein